MFWTMIGVMVSVVLFIGYCMERKQIKKRYQQEISQDAVPNIGHSAEQENLSYTWMDRP